jgi:hypothetical protein
MDPSCRDCKVRVTRYQAGIGGGMIDSHFHSHKILSAQLERCQLGIAQAVRTADRNCS